MAHADPLKTRISAGSVCTYVCVNNKSSCSCALRRIAYSEDRPAGGMATTRVNVMIIMIILKCDAKSQDNAEKEEAIAGEQV